MASMRFVSWLALGGAFAFAGCKKETEVEKAARVAAEVAQAAGEAAAAAAKAAAETAGAAGEAAGRAGEAAGEAAAAAGRAAAQAAGQAAQAAAQAGGAALGQAQAAAAQAAQAAAQAMGAAVRGAGKKLGPVVNWRKLAPFVPESLPGFESAGDLDGSTSGVGEIKVTRVRRRYRAGKRTATVAIQDTSLMPAIRAGFAMARNVTEDSTRRLRRPVEVGGQPGVLEWRKSGPRSKVQVLVGGRFLVEVSVRPAADTDEALALAGKLDLAGLADLAASKAAGK